MKKTAHSVGSNHSLRISHTFCFKPPENGGRSLTHTFPAAVPRSPASCSPIAGALPTHAAPCERRPAKGEPLACVALLLLLLPFLWCVLVPISKPAKTRARLHNNWWHHPVFICCFFFSVFVSLFFVCVCLFVLFFRRWVGQGVISLDPACLSCLRLFGGCWRFLVFLEVSADF